MFIRRKWKEIDKVPVKTTNDFSEICRQLCCFHSNIFPVWFLKLANQSKIKNVLLKKKKNKIIKYKKYKNNIIDIVINN